MAESLLKQQIEALENELSNLCTQVRSEANSNMRHLSSISLIPKWSGTDRGISVHESFDTLEFTAEIGNWSDSDKVRITVLILTAVAEAFYVSSVDRQGADVSWKAMKAKFLHKFRDVRPEQFHYVQLQTAKQR
jgi:hypothetical protein